MPKSDQEKAEKLYLEGSCSSYIAVAKKLGVSERTVKRWAQDGNWQAKKQAQEVASQAIASEVSELLERPIQATQVTGLLGSIKSEDIVGLALAVCYADLQDSELRSRSKAEVIASAEKMLKFQNQMSLHKYEIELRQIQIEKEKADLLLKQRQLKPPTLKEWLDLCLGEFGYTVRELMVALKELSSQGR